MVSMLETLKSLNIGGIISGTNKTLKTIKKAIPVYKEIRPYIRGEKKLLKKDEIIINDTNKKEDVDESNYNNNLTFFH